MKIVPYKIAFLKRKEVLYSASCFAVGLHACRYEEFLFLERIRKVVVFLGAIYVNCIRYLVFSAFMLFY